MFHSKHLYGKFSDIQLLPGGKTSQNVQNVAIYSRDWTWYRVCPHTLCTEMQARLSWQPWCSFPFIKHWVSNQNMFYQIKTKHKQTSVWLELSTMNFFIWFLLILKPIQQPITRGVNELFFASALRASHVIYWWILFILYMMFKIEAS